MDAHRFGALVCHRRFGKTVVAITICRLPRSNARCCGASSLGTGFVSASANGSRHDIVEAEFLEQTSKKGTAAQRIVRSFEPSFAHVITIVCHDRRWQSREHP